jgi:uncharacterized protein
MKMATITRLLDIITQVLIIVGALNWGLVGFFSVNGVDRLLGDGSLWSYRVYGLVGLAAIYQIYRLRTVSTCLLTTPTPPTTRELPSPH